MCEGKSEFVEDGHVRCPPKLFSGHRYQSAENMRLCNHCAKKAEQSPKDGTEPIIPDQTDQVREVWSSPSQS